MIGLHSFKLAYPTAGGDHWIKSMRVTLDFDPSPAKPVNKLVVPVRADMEDASGKHLWREEWR